MRNPRREALLALRALLPGFHSDVRGRIRRRVKTQVVVGLRFRAAGNGGFIAKFGSGLIGYPLSDLNFGQGPSWDLEFCRLKVHASVFERAEHVAFCVDALRVSRLDFLD